MSKQEPSSKALFAAIKQGDRRAYKLLFERFYQLLLATAINLLGDVNAAKDVIQEVFFEIWKKRAQIEVHSTVEGFLKRSVINRSLNLIKKRKRFTDDSSLQFSEQKEANAIETLEAEDLKKVIDEALDSLPERCRLIFVMKRMEKMSVKEIAEKLEVSPKTVENQITKALKKLKNTIAPYIKKEMNS